ncbi:MAG TPA: hypothetical protein VGR08_04925, partial [Thermomicrobiales bacterium]|nr:hypothetical protein [Thermomicrobiales bacterium]
MRRSVYRKRHFVCQPALPARLPASRPVPAGPFDPFLKNRPLAALGLLVLLMALAVRVITWAQLLPHIDEPATLLAIEMVATKGIPLLPSDVLYLQGTLISYLGAPFSFLFSGAELLSALQAVNLLASLSVVVLVYLITARITASVLASLFASAGVGLDPSMITWSIWVRPYGLLTIQTTALAYCFLVLIQDGTDARIGRIPVRYAMVALFWLGTLTHIGIWMILPSMILVAGMIWGLDLFGKHSRLITAGALAVIAPILLTILGSLVGVGSTTTNNEGGAGFVGDHLFNLEQIINAEVTLKVWEKTWHGSQLWGVMAPYVVAISGLLIGGYLQIRSPRMLMERRAIFAIIALYFGPILLIAALAAEGAQSRYLVHILPLGYVLIAVGAWHIARISSRTHLFGALSMRGLLVAMLLFPTIVFLLQASRWRMEFPDDDPDFFPAMAYVAERHEPGQPIFVSLPPAAFFTFDDDTVANDLYFLAGPEDRIRTTRYVKRQPDRSVTDYWLGVPAVTSTEQLCDMLREHA